MKLRTAKEKVQGGRRGRGAIGWALEEEEILSLTSTTLNITPQFTPQFTPAGRKPASGPGAPDGSTSWWKRWNDGPEVCMGVEWAAAHVSQEHQQ